MKELLNIHMPIHKSVEQNSDGDWIIEGIASTSGIDLFDDVILPDNFLNTLDFFKQKGQIFYNHNYARKSVEEGGTTPMAAQLPIGRALDAKITPEGLYIKAVLNKNHDLAKDLWHNHLNNPDPRFRDIGLSIGAKPKGQTVRKYSPEHGKYVNFLPEVILYEVSVTPTPVNADTWARVLKSIVDDVDLAETTDKQNNEVEIVNLKPEEVIYDSARNLIVVKSVIENEDGKTFVLEQTINPTEDILKAMDDTKNPKTPEKEEVKEETAAPAEAPAEGGESAPAGPPEGAPAEGAPAEGGDATGNPLEEMGGEGAPAEGGAPMPGAEGGPGDMMGEAGGEGGGLDDLFGGEGGGPEDPTATEGDSAAMSMILDKLDTLVDGITTLIQSQAESANTTEGIESTTTPPTPELNNDVMKSVVEFSTQMKDDIRVIVKSIVEETLLSTEFTNQLANVIIQSPVIKSISTDGNSGVTIIQPAVALSDGANKPQDKLIIKSFDGKELDVEVLKSYSTKLAELTGRGESVSQKRGILIHDGAKALGITENEFRYLTAKKY